jgi:hypothetical protein
LKPLFLKAVSLQTTPLKTGRRRELTDRFCDATEPRQWLVGHFVGANCSKHL